MLLVSAISAQIYTVDNSNDGADFTDLQVAINTAADGDTIYVASSNVSYGNISINKKLTIFGSGYLTNAFSQPTIIGTVTFSNNCKKSHLSGFEVVNINATATSSSIDSLTISDNLISGQINLYYRIGHIIEGNLFSRQNGVCIQASQGSSNTQAKYLKIRNNVFYGYIYRLWDVNSEVISNTFIRSGLLFNAYRSSTAGTLVNNIYFGITDGEVAGGCTGCISEFAYHYYHDGTDFAGENPMFVNPTTLTTDNITAFDINHDLSLQAGSTAIGGGQFGFDQGAYGGGNPFVRGGFPPVPRVVSITSPVSSIESGGTLEITINAVSQQ